jgi:hypothetical protein
MINFKNRAVRIATPILLLLLLLLAADIGFGYWGRRHILATYDTPVQNLYVLCYSIENYDEHYNTFPRYLPALGPPPAGVQPSRDFANGIDRDLAYGNKRGYTYRYHPIDLHSSGIFDAFEVFADPISDGSTKHHYFVDQTGIIRWELGKQASGASARKPPGADPNAPGGWQ